LTVSSFQFEKIDARPTPENDYFGSKIPLLVKSVAAGLLAPAAQALTLAAGVWQ